LIKMERAALLSGKVQAENSKPSRTEIAKPLIIGHFLGWSVEPLSHYWFLGLSQLAPLCNASRTRFPPAVHSISGWISIQACVNWSTPLVFPSRIPLLQNIAAPASAAAWPKHSDFPSGVLTLLVEVFRLSTFRTVKHQGNREIFRLNRRTGG
jgi:hypothetical protein